MATLAFDIFWRDHGAAKGAKDLGDNARAASGHVQTLGSHGKQLAAGFAGFAVAKIFDSFISGARESNVISRVTEQRIRSTGGAAHVTAGQVGDLTAAISNKTGADDEAVQSGANMLLTFTGVRNEVGKGNDVFNQATAAATDLAAGLNQGQVTAEGTQQAATMLGKALQDPIAGMTALRRVGISFTQSQVAQITALQKSGHTLEAQKIILAEVNKEFGGTARAAADPLQRLSVILGNVGENLGNDVLPAMNAVADVVAKIPGPVFVAGGALAAFGVGAIGVAKAVNAVRDISQGTAGIMRLLGIRTAEAAAAETAQAVAARSSAVSTAASGDAAAAAGVKFGTMAARLGVVAVAIGAIQGAKFVSEMTAGTVATDKLADSLTKVGQAGDSAEFRHLFSRAGIGNFTVDAQSATEAMDNFAAESEIAFGQGFSQKAQRLLSFGAASSGAAADIGKLDQGLAQMVKGGRIGDADAKFAALADRLRKMGFAQAEITAMFPQYTAAQHAAAAAADAASKANARTNDVLVGTKSTANVASTALHGLAVASGAVTLSAHAEHAAHLKLEGDLATLAQRTLGLRGADRELAAAQDDLTASIRTNGRSLADNTAKGRANGEALDRVASATLASLKAHRDSGEPLRQYAQRVRASRDALIAEAEKAGMSRTAAKRYADAILAVPRKQTTQYLTPGLNAARGSARGYLADLKRLQGVRTITVRANADGSFTKVWMTASGGTRSTTMRAAGGYISGPGGPRDDLVPALLSNGEYVVNARATTQHRQLLEAINSGRASRFAAGGDVSATSRVNYQSLPASHFTEAFTAGMVQMGSTLKNALGGGGGPIPGGSGVARWGPMVHRALARLGLAQSLWDNWMRQIATESGGNPNAINLWDSNARAGHPSQGLLQTIPGTFAAYHVPGTSWNIRDGWANMLAAMNYAKHRYSNMEAVIGHGHGYDEGGLARGRGWIPKPTRAPERVLSPRQTEAFERLVPMLSRGGAMQVTMNVTVDGGGSLFGIEDRVVDAFTSAARRGRLKGAVRTAAGL